MVLIKNKIINEPKNVAFTLLYYIGD